MAWRIESSGFAGFNLNSEITKFIELKKSLDTMIKATQSKSILNHQ